MSAAAEEAVRLQAVPQAFSRYDARAYALAELPEFRRALDGVLPGDAPGWLRGLQGPSPRAGWVRIGDRGYVVTRSCKPHACKWNRVIMLFRPVAPYRLVAALAQDRDEDGPAVPAVRWLGRPTPEEQAVLESLLGPGHRAGGS